MSNFKEFLEKNEIADIKITADPGSILSRENIEKNIVEVFNAYKEGKGCTYYDKVYETDTDYNVRIDHATAILRKEND